MVFTLNLLIKETILMITKTRFYYHHKLSQLGPELRQVM